MKVKLLADLGFRQGRPAHRGDIFDVDEGMADNWIAIGAAVEVKEPKPTQNEKDIEAVMETTEKPGTEPDYDELAEEKAIAESEVETTEAAPAPENAAKRTTKPKPSKAVS